MTIYEKFTNSCLDLTALGLQDGPSVSQYSTKVLGWLIGSSVHFCQLSEQGETVFAVDPNGLPDEQLLPVAEDIPNFIGLLIRCKDAALIAGAYQWSSFRFREQIDAIQPSMKARSVIRALENTYLPPVIDDPGTMMSKLRKELADTSRKTDWKVGFEKDFLQSCSKAKSGKELAPNRSLSTWHVPSVYMCEEGIVVDTFLEVSTDSIVDFHRNWSTRSEETLSLSDKLQRQLDDPLTAAYTGILMVNDKPLRCKRSFTAIWNPLCDNSPQVRGILNRYHLDPDCGYLFRRYCFLRKGKCPQIRSMQLTLEATPVMVPAESFTIQETGMRLRFSHPSTGLEHTLTVLSVSKEALNPNFLTNHPCYYTRLTYALEPSISPENFRIVDLDPGDRWEGYQDEPSAVIFADRKPDPGRYALSSLHYEPQDHVRWQMIFRRKLHKDIQIELLP